MITLNSKTAKQYKYKTLQKLNFKINVTICYHKNLRKLRLKRKSTKKKKINIQDKKPTKTTTNKQNKDDTL